MSLSAPRPGPPTPDRALAVYYGQGGLQALQRYRLAALHPAQYSPAQLQWLRTRGVTPLAYLSVGEDSSPQPAAWTRASRNAAWDTWYVDVGHAGWAAHLHAQADAALEQFGGLFLDTLDGSALFPTDRVPLLRLVEELRLKHPRAYLLANRGFDLLPELAGLVDGVLLESFTTTWLDGYRRLHAHELAYTGAQLRRVRACGLPAFALDYARTPAQRLAARRRARTLGVPTFISTRELNVL